MTSRLIIEQHISNESPPAFRGLAGAEPVVVELDNSAALKLAGKAIGQDRRPAIEAAHDRVRVAAERLYETGAFHFDGAGDRTDGVMHIRLSALDLE